MAGIQCLLLVCISLVTGAVQAFDKYADARAKYAMWEAKYGLVAGQRRNERNTERQNRIPIFIPHRPTNGGKQFQVEDVSLHTHLLGLEGQLDRPRVRSVRGNTHINEVGLGGAEYVSQQGIPLYKLRKRYPHYGRRKRSTGQREVRQGWTLLDPNTGRPIQSPTLLSDSPSIPVQRLTRNPEDITQSVSVSRSSEYLSEDGTPLYKRRKTSPYFGRRKRAAVERILNRVPREPQGWALLDPNTGRPIQSVGVPPNLRTVRRPTESDLSVQTDYRSYTTSDGRSQPIYKYYKKYPFGYSG